MTKEIIQNLQEKIQIYQKLFEFLTLTPLLNSLTSTSSTLTSLTPILTTLPTITPTPLTITPTPASTFSSKIIVKPNKRYIKVEEILKLTNLTKNEYNNFLVS